MINSRKILLFDELNTNAALAMTRHLNGLGYQVDLLVPENHPARYSKHCHHCYTFEPPVNNPDLYAKMLLERLGEKPYLTVFIFEDHLMEIVCKHIKMIQPYTYLSLPKQYENINLCLNKKTSFKFVDELGIPIPQTIYVNKVDELISIKDAITYPIIVKGERGTAGLHVRKAKNFNELLLFYLEVEALEKKYSGRPFIQEMIKGFGYVCHVLATRGQVVSLCIHKKIHEIPTTGGITAMGETTECEEIKEHTLKIIRALNWEGLAKLDYIHCEKSNRFLFLEIDPRISASIDICRVAGTSMIEKALNLLKGNSVEIDLNYKNGIQYSWAFPNDLLYHLCTKRFLKYIIMPFFNKSQSIDLNLEDFKPEIQKIVKSAKIVFKNFHKRTFWQGQIHL